MNQAMEQAMLQAEKDESNLYEKFIGYTSLFGNDKRFCDSDMPKGESQYDNATLDSRTDEAVAQFEQNKADVIRLIGYEPFA